MPEPDERGDSFVPSSFPWRLVVGAAAMAISVCLALLAWADRGGAGAAGAATDAAVEQHQLTADQAACLRFGLVTSRSETRSLSLLLSSYSTLDPSAGDLLRAEIDDLDEIGGDFPDADFRLVNSIAATADADALVLARGHTIIYRSTVTSRSQAHDEAHAACREIAAFDTVALKVRETPDEQR